MILMNLPDILSNFHVGMMELEHQIGVKINEIGVKMNESRSIIEVFNRSGALPVALFHQSFNCDYFTKSNIV